MGTKSRLKSRSYYGHIFLLYQYKSEIVTMQGLRAHLFETDYHGIEAMARIEARF
jgi:hypothetical protein